MAKYGILIDYNWCTGCHTCEIACQMEHALPVGQSGIIVNEIGPWEYAPDTWQYTYLPSPTDQCDLCASRLKEGKQPTCVKHCQARCMKFGLVDDLAGEIAGKRKQVLFTV